MCPLVVVSSCHIVPLASSSSCSIHNVSSCGGILLSHSTPGIFLQLFHTQCVLLWWYPLVTYRQYITVNNLSGFASLFANQCQPPANQCDIWFADTANQNMDQGTGLDADDKPVDKLIVSLPAKIGSSCPHIDNRDTGHQLNSLAQTSHQADRNQSFVNIGSVSQ